MKFINVLRKGECLSNPKLYKKLQDVVNLIIGNIPFIILMFPSMKSFLTVENLVSVGSGLAAFNVYFTNATSDKVGF